jgi:hypothetical protein
MSLSFDGTLRSSDQTFAGRLAFSGHTVSRVDQLKPLPVKVLRAV